MHKLCKILFFADQMHLRKYGRSITGDTYIAMHNGPVPSCVYDIFKAVRGDSYFTASEDAQRLKMLMRFDNKYDITGKTTADMDELSGSDIECLDTSIAKCKNLSFAALTELSHGLAWSNTQRDREISVKDIMREAGVSEGVIDYIVYNQKLQSAALS